MAGPDGEPCSPNTRGELQRLHVHMHLPLHIGRESNELEEVQAWLTPPSRTYVTYIDEQSEWERVRRVLKTIPRKRLAKISGLHVRSIKAIVNSSRLPHWKHRQLLWEIAQNLNTQEGNGQQRPKRSADPSKTTKHKKLGLHANPC